MTTAQTRRLHRRDAGSLLQELIALRAELDVEVAQALREWRPIARRAFRLSASNFAAYLALRRRDLRELQLELMPYGLSTFGRSESRVLPSLDAVIATLGSVVDSAPRERSRTRAFFRGERLLGINTAEVFGPAPEPRRTRIMVTLGSEAATDPGLLDALVSAGMDCARINCAHDGEAAWRAMVANIRAAEARQNRVCKIYFDLAGPKVRTESVQLPEPGHRVHIGDRLLLTSALEDRHAFPVQFTCSIPSVLERLQPGNAVWINDGHVGCVVEGASDGGVVLIVKHARLKGEHVKPEKGLNFPGVDLHLSALTETDRHNLTVIAPLADVIGYSFVRSAADVVELQEALTSAVPARDRLPLALKIETAQSVHNLPALIVACARRNPTAVMIARGDLAVEIDYPRLAEMQEEILWLCEAAHVPVIWATEVLDRFVRDGTPSRAEFTDAAAGERAECVMLNKGPFVVDAVGVLGGVLRRMEADRAKNMPLLRALKSWN